LRAAILAWVKAAAIGTVFRNHPNLGPSLRYSNCLKNPLYLSVLDFLSHVMLDEVIAFNIENNPYTVWDYAS
jgi:hypothetical protein